MTKLSEIIENTIRLYNTNKSIEGIQKFINQPTDPRDKKNPDFGKDTLQMLKDSKEKLEQYFFDEDIEVDNCDITAIRDNLEADELGEELEEDELEGEEDEGEDEE